MFEHQNVENERKSWPAYALAGVLSVVAGFVAIYVSLPSDGNGITSQPAETVSSQPAPSNTVGVDLKSFRKGDMITFVVKSSPVALPDVSFNDQSGSPVKLSKWRGKVVLLNLWATWCAPCRKEMPDLDKLKAKLGGSDFDVVAISIDNGTPDKPKKFLDKIGVRSLNFYHDPTMQIIEDLTAFGMPTTLLIDREGRELGRLVGPANWASDDAIALMGAAINASS